MGGPTINRPSLRKQMSAPPAAPASFVVRRAVGVVIATRKQGARSDAVPLPAIGVDAEAFERDGFGLARARHS